VGFHLEGRQFARQAVGTEGSQKVELSAAGRGRAAIGEVHDFALMDAIDRVVRLLDEALQSFGQPMIAASRATQVVHALLDNGPMAIVGDDEAVQVKIKSVLHRCAIDLRHQAAHAGQRRPVDSDPLPDRCEFNRRLSRLLAATAADMEPEFSREGLEASLERPDHARGYARGVPVHAHDRAERLEPERMSEATQQLVAAIGVDDRLADDGSESGHAVREPQRHPPAVQRQVGASCSTGHALS
jgi:hypothetical protein